MGKAVRGCTAGLVAAGLLVTAACGGSSGKHPATTAPAPSTTPPSTTAAPQPAPKNPYTGIGAVPTSPTIAVKIDDTAPGRPQVGIDKADIVYIEAVEGGLTRLAAIFGTTKPTAVGYVRSTRPADPDLLLQFGKITEAYSGGAHDSLPLVHKSGITSWSNDDGAPYYARVNRAASSYINLVLNVAKVAARTHSAKPKPMGWTFDASLAGLPATTGTDVRTSVNGSYTHGTPVEFRWDTRLHSYVRYINGVAQRAADGKWITAANVIVQFCKVVAHPEDSDVLGNPAQFTYTVGTGKVAVFRQGKRIDGTWSRPNVASGTTLRTTAGQALPLNPGNTWVILATTGTPLAG